MPKRIINFWILLLVATLGYAQSLRQYEYWMDSDYSKHTTVKSYKEDIALDIDISNLDKGIHYLNIRVQNDAGDWGTLNRYLFFIPDESSPDATITDYEYWIDSDYAKKQVKKISGEDIALSVDIENLTYGIHYFNFRAKNSDGIWGNLSRYLFFVPEVISEDATVTDYEYWMDNEYSAKQSAKVSSGDIALNIDISSLSPGVHYLNFRAKNSDNVWGNLSRYLFFVPEPSSEDAKVTGYEYWMDDDYAGKNFVDANDGQFVASIDISKIGNGMHYFNFRAKNSDSVWGNLSRYLVYIPADTGETNSPIVGYRYNFNRLYTYIPLTDRMEFTLTNYVIDIPDLIDMGSLEDGCNYTFDRHNMKVKLDRNANVSFAIQFKNKAGDWSSPAASQFEMSDNIEKEMQLLLIQKYVTFDKVSMGDYQAFVMDIDEYRNYYLKSDQSCSIQLFEENGSLLTTLSPESLLNTYQIGLPQGVYYGIVYNMAKDESNSSDQLTIKLMLTNNIVPTPVIKYENEIVSITCLQEGAAIYYTLDGTVPTKESIRYTNPFYLNHNAVLRAIAIYNDMADSDIAELKIDSYKVQNPTIEFTNLQLYMACATEGSSIFYTLDGSDPVSNGERYTYPVAITSNCVAKAVGKREGYNHSDIVTLNVDISNVKTSTPVIVREGNGISVTSRTEGARFYYTTDGTMPTAASASTDRYIQTERNCTVTVIAMKVGEIPSDPVQFIIDWLKVDTPLLVFADGQLTISCSTPNAVIYYEIGEGLPTRDSERYTAPLSLTDNRPVNAFAVADGLIDSDVAVYNPSSFTCEKPVFAFDGYHLNISTATEGATIHYTTDGSNPGNNSPVYNQTIFVHSIMTVRAITMKENTNSSKLADFTIPSYYDGEIAEVGTVGSLSHAFDWCNTESISDLELRGSMNAEDLRWMKSLNNLQHLDMSQVDIEGNKLPDEAFANMSLVSIAISSSISTVGNKLFNGCPKIAAIVWKPNIKLTEQALYGVENPNLLLYVNIASDAPAIVKNVVVNGIASNITLTDAEGNNSFYCPEGFTAANISYTHHYSMQSGMNECRGWETLALPFDVQQIKHESNGFIVPFGVSDSDSKHFWLSKLEESGFEDADRIEANTPYIISMPNNSAYADSYMLGGNVIFSAQNTKVHVSSELVKSSKGVFSFVPSFVITEKNERILPINVNESFDGYPEGSNFFRDLNRSIRPFEAYIYDQSGNASRFSIEEGITGVTGITVEANTMIRIFNLEGQLIYSGPNMIRLREHLGLKPGIYVVNGKKKIIR